MINDELKKANVQAMKDKDTIARSNYSVVLDGFIVSDNIMVTSVTNISQEGEELFLYSDHNPVEMKFVLL